MGSEQEHRNRTMLRVRDRIDREFADELDLAALAAGVHYSPDHLVRTFRRVFGETPHRYLQRRRVERAMFLLRTTRLPVTEICLQVGFSSVGAFGELFTAVVGEPPTTYRDRGPLPAAPAHFVRAWTRPSSHTDAAEPTRPTPDTAASSTPPTPDASTPDTSVSRKRGATSGA